MRGGAGGARGGLGSKGAGAGGVGLTGWVLALTLPAARAPHRAGVPGDGNPPETAAAVSTQGDPLCSSSPPLPRHPCFPGTHSPQPVKGSTGDPAMSALSVLLPHTRHPATSSGPAGLPRAGSMRPTRVPSCVSSAALRPPPHTGRDIFSRLARARNPPTSPLSSGSSPRARGSRVAPWVSASAAAWGLGIHRGGTPQAPWGPCLRRSPFSLCPENK